jgi:phage gp36-like protein
VASTYASIQDIIDLYGEATLIRVSDVNRDRQYDAEVVDAALENADDEINVYLSAQYDVPLIYTTRSLRRIAVNIAIYTMALGRAERTDEMRKRYEDAIKLLTLMKDGKVGLGLPLVDGDGDGVAETNPNRTRKGRTFDVFRA